MGKNKFEFDYNKILDETVKKFALTIETYGGVKSEQSVSSGMLCTDLLLGNAGWMPGWHTSAGFEQSAKTTTATMTLVEALKLGIPMIQVWDFEGSFDKNYVINFWNNNGDGSFAITDETFGIRNPDGSWKVKPRIPSYKVDTGEEFFTALHHTLKRMPKKQRIGEKWYLIFKKDKASKALVGSNYDEKMYRTMDVYAVEVPDGRPQGILMLDSYPTMNPELLDGDEGSKRMAAAASMFSDNMKRVKSMLSSRKVIVLGINQMRLRPGPSFGNPEYEPGGEALKLNSEIRIKHFPHISPPAQFRVVGERDGINMIEKGINGGNDIYKYIKLTTIKNKVGGAPAGSQVYQRVWVADEAGEARGLDPVFDAWQFMSMIGMVKGNIKAFEWKPKWLKGVKVKKMSIVDLKVLMFGDKEQKQALCKKFGIEKNPKIAENLRAMLMDGTAYTMFKGGALKEEEDDDDDE
jgi:RecA/RadA recombinase